MNVYGLAVEAGDSPRVSCRILRPTNNLQVYFSSTYILARRDA
jgi:hypothetical protein